MKKWISVLQLACSSIPSLLMTVSLPVCLLQGIGFGLAMGKHALLEDIIAASCAGLFFKIGLMALALLLMLHMSGIQGSQVAYTLSRLRISHKATLLPFSLAAIACLAVFWALQCLYMTGLCLIYMKFADLSILSAQTVMLAFYRSEFLHSLMPLADLAANLSNGIWIVCMGISAALFAYHLRSGRKSLIPLYLLAMHWVLMGLEMGFDLFRYAISFYNLFAVGWGIWAVWRFKYEEEN